jgi:hypothetical protein
VWDIVDPHHTPSESLETLSDLDIPIATDFKMLMIVRHPYTRILSLYNRGQSELLKLKIDTFDYLLDLLEARNNNDSQATYLIGGKIFDKQTMWTHDPNTFNLNIMKYEELNVNAIKDYLNLPALSLPEINRNTIPADQCQLQSYQKNKIYSIYQNEFDAYCYQK